MSAAIHVIPIGGQRVLDLSELANVIELSE